MDMQNQIPTPATEEVNYVSLFNLLQEFTTIPNIDKAWLFNSHSTTLQGMFYINQPDLVANKTKKLMLSCQIFKESESSVNFLWAPFPIEISGVSLIIPSPSGSKLLLIWNPKDDESPCRFEIWSLSRMEKDFHIPQSLHGSVYNDRWFEGVSWNLDETFVAYVAEEPSLSKPEFRDAGYKKGGGCVPADKNCGTWKGQGDLEEDWGETYAGKRRPALFVINISSGEVQAVKGIDRSLSVGQVVWAPFHDGSEQYLVFVGWSGEKRKLGMKYCSNRPCALYAVRAPHHDSKSNEQELNSTQEWYILNLTRTISSALFPRFSGEVAHISPADPSFSWNLLTLDGNNIIAICSSPVDVPQIKYGTFTEKSKESIPWSWSDISSPMFRCSDKVRSSLFSLKCSILKIPIKEACQGIAKGASNPFEAIFVSSKSKKNDPLIVILHGGPHDVSLSCFSKSWAFLSSVGYSLLIVNYRGSLGFGEEALQSLPGKVGCQDVNDVLSAIDEVIKLGVASPSKITVMGISHGGFLTTHLIGQSPDKFVAAAAINPVCNLALMVGTTDIPDWCYVEAFGTNSKHSFTQAPSPQHLTLFYNKSPISHLSKVKAPTLFLLGAKDVRVPIYDGLQYARALKEKGVDVKTIMFPNDVHGLQRPQSEFECFLNIAVWFNKYCKLQVKDHT